MADLFHHGNRVHFFFGMLARINEYIEKFLHVGHIEVTCHDQVAAAPVVLSQERMHAFNVVDAMSAVAQMTKPKLARKSQVFFEPLLIAKFSFAFHLCFLVLFRNFFEKMRNRLSFDRTIATKESESWFLIDFYV